MHQFMMARCWNCMYVVRRDSPMPSMQASTKVYHVQNNVQAISLTPSYKHEILNNVDQTLTPSYKHEILNNVDQRSIKCDQHGPILVTHSSMSHSISSRSFRNALYLVHIYKWQTYIVPKSKLKFIVLKASSITACTIYFFDEVQLSLCWFSVLG